MPPLSASEDGKTMGIYKDPRYEVELPWRRFDPRWYRPGVDVPAWASRILDERALTAEEHDRAMREMPPARYNFKPDIKEKRKMSELTEKTKPLADLLDEAPAALRKPLALVNGRAYATIWPYVRLTGSAAKHEQRMMVVRDDGKVFGPGGDHVLEELGLEVRLPEIPPNERLWSAAGVKAFCNGHKSDPADVYSRVVDTVDRFIDFDRSLADQRTMSEMIGCYAVSTWFLDAFSVAGYLWPNGERGSGKTQLLNVVAELSYLGQVILGGGSYPALRDMADYGAFMAFDDAENFSDPRRTDPDKRALLLAGNRRGTTVPVKESISDRGWRTRYVNAYGARAFSAIRIPDAVLASRTIIVPLIRTPDRLRANADPLEYDLWPHDRRRLLDDLWSMGLTYLAEMPKYERAVNDRSRLTGRSLEPWRALLAAALWLEGCGIEGLCERMSALSLAYQTERKEMEWEDLTTLVARGLLRLTQQYAPVPPADALGEVWSLRVVDITEAVRDVAEERDPYADSEWVTPRRVGRVMGTMRFRKDPSASRTNWLVAAGEVRRWLTSLGIADQTLEDDVPVHQSAEYLDEDERLEQAAILEFSGGLRREDADRLSGISQA
jgi:hypothetical protein